MLKQREGIPVASCRLSEAHAPLGCWAPVFAVNLNLHNPFGPPTIGQNLGFLGGFNGMNHLNGLNGTGGPNSTGGLNGLNGMNGVASFNGVISFNGFAGLNQVPGNNGMMTMSGPNGANGVSNMTGMNGTSGIVSMGAASGLGGLNGVGSAAVTEENENEANVARQTGVPKPTANQITAGEGNSEDRQSGTATGRSTLRDIVGDAPVTNPPLFLPLPWTASASGSRRSRSRAKKPRPITELEGELLSLLSYIPHATIA